VRGGHEISETRGISAFQGIDRLKDAFIFPDHMAGAAFHESGEIGGLELLGGSVAEGFDTHAAGGFETLLAALVVFSADEGVLHSGVDHKKTDTRRQRNRFNRFGTAIKKDEMILAAKDRRGLVEKAAIHTHEIVFRTAAEFRDLEGREWKRVKLQKQSRRGDFESGGTRKARAAGKGRGKADRKSSRLGAGACEHFGNPERIVGPFSRALKTRTTIDFFNSLQTFAGLNSMRPSGRRSPVALTPS
jgi:hypothetical protein